MKKILLNSTNSVNRILDSICDDKLIKNNGTLPEVFGIDELTATKDTKSKYAFIIVVQIKHNACGYRKFKHLKFRIMLSKDYEI